MALPADILVRLPEEGARRLALEFLAEAAQAAARLRKGSDPQALHDFRVGVRRLRSTLAAWKEVLKGSARKKHRRILRALAARTGAGRDLEVAVEWVTNVAQEALPAEQVGMHWLIERLKARSEQALAEVRATVPQQFEGLLPRLRRGLLRCCLALDALQGRASLAQALVPRVRGHTRQLVERLSAIPSAGGQAEMHAARICGKRLRYLLEPLRGSLDGASELVAECKVLQCVLGDLHDVEVQRVTLDEARGAAGRQLQAAPLLPGLQALASRLQERQAELRIRLERGWLGDGAAKLAAAAGRVLRACAEAGRQDVEIERKFLLRAAPAQMPPGRVVQIEQGWLPGRRLRERLRRRTEAGEVTTCARSSWAAG